MSIVGFDFLGGSITLEDQSANNVCAGKMNWELQK